MDSQLLIYGAIALGFLAVVGLAVATPAGAAGKQIKRAKSISEGGGSAVRSRALEASQKRKQMDASIKGLRDREAAIRSRKQAGQSIEDRIKQSGLKLTVPSFWIGSGVLGAVAGGTAFFLGFTEGWKLAVPPGMAFVFGLGAPRWILGMAISMRQKKFTSQFADAIDVIVRGVKSGLPLNECLKVIAKESSQPLAGEFEQVVDAMSMGVTLDAALLKMYQRTPIPEVNFFNIVLGIQQKAGGNLSEALGNLSNVLRSRKLLREKIKALSSEAKASAMIIGSLPIVVMVLVYLTTPDYIMTLFIHPTGNLLLLIGAALMSLGIYIMRQMINFDF